MKMAKLRSIPVNIVVLIYLVFAVLALVFLLITNQITMYELVLFPTVVIGFWIAMAEFRKSQVYPQIKLHWQGDMSTGFEDDALCVVAPKNEEKIIYVNLFVENIGDGLTTWYRISFDIPRELAAPMSEAHKVSWLIGTKESNWNEGSNLQATRHSFNSNGQYSLYPDEGQIHYASLAIILFPGLKYPNVTEIAYSVVTDKTKIRKEVLTIKIVEEFKKSAE